jgi:hypothetical protein
MQKRFWVLLISMMAVCLVLGGSVSATADTARKITGGFISRGFFTVAQGWFNFSIHEVGSGPDGARGWVKWKEYDEDLGWRRVQARAICVAFGEYVGQPAATVVVQIDNRTGWGEGNPGDYMKF